MSTEIIEVKGKIEPRDIMNREINIAHVARQLIEQCTVNIQGQKHLKFEGWCGLARLTNCMISTESVTVEEDGVSAVAVVKDLNSGEIIGRGEGFVGADELVWFGGTIIDRYGKEKRYNKRPMAAIRAFAQTRAGARAARMAMSSLVILMGKEYSATPAEEMPHDEEPEPQPAKVTQSPATPPKQPVKPDAMGMYPSGVSVTQLKQIGELIKATGSDRNQLLREFGDPSVKEASYHLMLSHLNRKVAEMEGGQEDAEAETLQEVGQ